MVPKTQLFNLAFFVIIVLFLGFIDRGQISGDGTVRWNTLVFLMEEKHLSPDKYSVIQPLLTAPLYVASDVACSISQVSPEYRLRCIKKGVQRFNKFVLLALFVLFYRVVLARFDFSERQAAFATMLLLFGSLLVPNAKDYYSECLVTLLAFAALVLLADFARSDRPLEAWRVAMFLAATIALIPLNPVCVIPFSAVLLALTIGRHRLRAVVIGSLGLIAGVLFALSENEIRRGHPFDFGYPGEGFSTPLLYGLTGLTVSPTRGFLFFVPSFLFGFVVWLKAKRKRSAGDVLIAISLVYSLCLLFTYSKWHDWHGSWYWGPRYLLPLSLFGALYIAVFIQRHWNNSKTWLKVACIACVVASVAVYKVGISIHQKYLLTCLANDLGSESCYWDFSYFPYSSFFKLEELSAMIVHRSTIVELFAACLFIVLLRRHRVSERVRLAGPGAR